MIFDLLKGKTPKERMEIKSSEIVKYDFVGQYTDEDITIDIQSFGKILNGIQFYARAWKNGVQLGFGIDGTTEIERFRIINPPINIIESTGKTLVQTKNLKGEPVCFPSLISKLKEDPVRAITEAIVRIIKTNGKLGTVILGTVGHTTSTYYATNDDTIHVEGAWGTWSTVHGATSGTVANSFGDNRGYVQISQDAGYEICRYFMEFATTDLVGETISSASIGITSHGNSCANLIDAANVYSSTHSSPLVAGDYDLCGTTAFSTAITENNWGADGALNTFSLNASGISNINLSSASKFSLRESNYEAPNTDPGSTGAYTCMGFYSSAAAGTTKDPVLTVVHTAAANIHGLSLLGVGT